MASTRGQTTKFAQNETVLCYEPDPDKAKVLYESKVLEIDFTKDEKGRRIPEYYIHFSGWNKSWDRWVTEDQVLKDNEANRIFMAKTHDLAVKAQKKRKRSAHSEGNDSKSSKGSNADDRKKSGTSSETESSTNFIEVQIEIPSQLKLKLEDDCYFIKRKKKLVSLPRDPNVVQVLSGYYDHYESLCQEDSSLPKSKSLVQEVLDGLRIYFDFTLPTLLLYNIEKEQYREVMKISDKEMVPNYDTDSNRTDTERTQDSEEESKSEDTEKDKRPGRVLRGRTSGLVGAPSNNTPETQTQFESSPQKGKKSDEMEATPSLVPNQMPSSSFPSGLSTSSLQNPSQVYGPEHLLRLFVKLPGLLSRTNIPERNLKLLLQQIEDFLRYMAENSETLLPQDVYTDHEL